MLRLLLLSLLLTTPYAYAQWATPISQDLALGDEVAKEILSKPAEYPIVDEKLHPEAYRYLRGIVDNLMTAGGVKYANDFKWEVWIINKDVKNAFCAPGGKIFVYTGLIRYLSAEHELAGVMGHEIAHADLRHTARQMEKTAFITVLANAGAQYAGGGNVAKQIAGGAASVIGLKFSRSNEREADQASVRYLCNTKYAADGAAAFFEKISQEPKGSSRQLSFLNTHPDPGNRIADIRKTAAKRNCGPKPPETIAYQVFINSLPQAYQ